MGWILREVMVKVRLKARAILSLVLIVAMAGKPSPGGGKVYVYYPSLARPLAIQESLARNCPGLEITVFARLADLEAQVAQEKPEILVAPGMVLGPFRGYASRLQGVRNGSTTENFVLLSLEKPVDMGRVSKLEIGVVGILERAEMGAFINGLVGGTPRLNRVTKVEDLLPLLIFHSVDAVLVSESNMAELQRKSQEKLTASRLEKGQVTLTALAVREGFDAKEMLMQWRHLDAGSLRMLGVDGWK